MHMVGHDDKRAKLIMAEFYSLAQRIHHQLSDRILTKEHGPRSGFVELAIDPDEGLARRCLVRRRVQRRRKAAVQSAR